MPQVSSNHPQKSGNPAAASSAQQGLTSGLA